MGEPGEQSADGAMASMQALRECYATYTREMTVADDEWWNKLPEDDRVKAFRCVCRRIYQGDVVDRGSYRHVLYQVFGFGLEAYGDGMECGYMAIHNLIFGGLENVKRNDDA